MTTSLNILILPLAACLANIAWLIIALICIINIKEKYTTKQIGKLLSIVKALCLAAVIISIVYMLFLYIGLSIETNVTTVRVIHVTCGIATAVLFLYNILALKEIPKNLTGTSNEVQFTCTALSMVFVCMTAINALIFLFV